MLPNHIIQTNDSRREFLQKLGVFSIGLSASNFIPVNDMNRTFSASEFFQNFTDIKSMHPSDVFSVINLQIPELKNVRLTLEKKGYEEALQELLRYYRNRYPDIEINQTESGLKNTKNLTTRADKVIRHIFQWGPYPEADYGPDIDWSADPAGDIEWVASVYRFYWAADLISAYESTKDEKYAKAFVELTSDWIEKHPLEKTIDAIHPVYGPGVYGSGGWKGYAWLDLQTGIRATNICKSFRSFIHSDSFTPQFLAILLASLYDHQVKTELMPMNMVHNKAIFEQRGFFNVIHTFPEYNDKERWLEIGIKTTSENLIAQTTSGGVQREWCGGYHSGVYRDALEIMGRVEDMGQKMPEYYRQRVKLMADHIFGISTPDLSFPMFGDTKRNLKKSEDRSTWELYDFLIRTGRQFNDPKFEALANLDENQLPRNGSIAFSEAGLYALRNNWTPDQTYMALHCSPPGLSNHDTPDNGTFELYSNGRWLLTDSGYFTYGNNLEARNWHRQTRVHSTLTSKGENTERAGRQLHWSSSNNQDVLVIENQSYSRLIHRRTVWFVGKNDDQPFFVILDEAIGDRKGDLAIHFPMAPGEVHFDENSGRIETRFDDANLLIKVTGKEKINLSEEDGWHAWSYGKRVKRTSVSAIYKGQGPFSFVSILVPYKGTTTPDVKLITNPNMLIAGMDPVNLEVEVDNKKWSLQRNIF